MGTLLASAHSASEERRLPAAKETEREKRGVSALRNETPIKIAAWLFR